MGLVLVAALLKGANAREHEHDLFRVVDTKTGLAHVITFGDLKLNVDKILYASNIVAKGERTTKISNEWFEVKYGGSSLYPLPLYINGEEDPNRKGITLIKIVLRGNEVVEFTVADMAGKVMTILKGSPMVQAAVSSLCGYPLMLEEGKIYYMNDVGCEVNWVSCDNGLAPYEWTSDFNIMSWGTDEMVKYHQKHGLGLEIMQGRLIAAKLNSNILVVPSDIHTVDLRELATADNGPLTLVIKETTRIESWPLGVKINKIYVSGVGQLPLDFGILCRNDFDNNIEIHGCGSIRNLMCNEEDNEERFNSIYIEPAGKLNIITSFNNCSFQDINIDAGDKRVDFLNMSNSLRGEQSCVENLMLMGSPDAYSCLKYKSISHTKAIQRDDSYWSCTIEMGEGESVEAENTNNARCHARHLKKYTSRGYKKICATTEFKGAIDKVEICNWSAAISGNADIRIADIMKSVEGINIGGELKIGGLIIRNGNMLIDARDKSTAVCNVVGICTDNDSLKINPELFNKLLNKKNSTHTKFILPRASKIASKFISNGCDVELGDGEEDIANKVNEAIVELYGEDFENSGLMVMTPAKVIKFFEDINKPIYTKNRAKLSYLVDKYGDSLHKIVYVEPIKRVADINGGVDVANYKSKEYKDIFWIANMAVGATSVSFPNNQDDEQLDIGAINVLNAMAYLVKSNTAIASEDIAISYGFKEIEQRTRKWKDSSIRLVDMYINGDKTKNTALYMLYKNKMLFATLSDWHLHNINLPETDEYRIGTLSGAVLENMSVGDVIFRTAVKGERPRYHGMEIPTSINSMVLTALQFGCMALECGKYTLHIRPENGDVIVCEVGKDTEDKENVRIWYTVLFNGKPWDVPKSIKDALNKACNVAAYKEELVKIQNRINNIDIKKEYRGSNSVLYPNFIMNCLQDNGEADLAYIWAQILDLEIISSGLNRQESEHCASTYRLRIPTHDGSIVHVRELWADDSRYYKYPKDANDKPKQKRRSDIGIHIEKDGEQIGERVYGKLNGSITGIIGSFRQAVEKAKDTAAGKYEHIANYVDNRLYNTDAFARITYEKTSYGSYRRSVYGAINIFTGKIFIIAELGDDGYRYGRNNQDRKCVLYAQMRSVGDAIALMSCETDANVEIDRIAEKLYKLHDEARINETWNKSYNPRLEQFGNQPSMRERILQGLADNESVVGLRYEGMYSMFVRQPSFTEI